MTANENRVRGRRALLVVDVQVGCFTEEIPRADQAALVSRVNALSRQVRRDGIVVFIQHTDPLEGFERGSAAWQLVPELEVEPGDPRMEKEGCDAFLETGLDSLLCRHGVTDVIVAGCATEFCVDSTVRAAASKGYHVSVPSDAHTTAGGPPLSGREVIRHHNHVWAELLLPRRQKIRVAPTTELLG